MLVFCEECGSKNNVDPNIIAGGEPDPPPRCSTCDTILLIPSSGTPPPTSVVVSQPLHLLELRFHDHIIEISQERPNVTMGRQRHNDLVVQDNRVSRSHARFEYRKGKFVLIDQSTNGTYVFIKGKKGMNLKQDELPVHGNGIIGLGRKVTSDSPQAIHFTII
jgi:adenylate cyclase